MKRVERKNKSQITLYIHGTVNNKRIRENTHMHLTGDKTTNKLAYKKAELKMNDMPRNVLEGRHLFVSRKSNFS